MSKTLACILLILGITSNLFAQNYTEGERFKVGLKAGPSFSLLVGTALTNSTPGYGFTGGVYYKYKLGGGFHFQTEITPSIRNSKFSNHASNGYEKISLFYIDASQLILKDLKKGSHAHCLVAGIAPTGLLQSWVYNSYYLQSPAARDIKLNTFDALAVFGYQHNRKIIGFQTLVKVGLTNINRGLNMHDNNGNKLQPTNDRGYIRNISWEATISF